VQISAEVFGRSGNKVDKIENGEGDIQAGVGDEEGVMGRVILDGWVLFCDGEW
jgi:hypothetical protein